MKLKLGLLALFYIATIGYALGMNVVADETMGSGFPLSSLAQPENRQNLYDSYNIKASLHNFRFDASFVNYLNCFNHHCRGQAQIGLHSSEEDIFQNLFATGASNAQEERKLISLAIGYFEYFSSRKKEVWSWDDKAGESTPSAKTSKTTQNNAFDESINTTSFLLILQNSGLLRFHKVGPILENSTSLLLVHSAASIIQLEGEQQFAVDSGSFDNGLPALILPLSKWPVAIKGRRLYSSSHPPYTAPQYRKALKEAHVSLEVFE